MKRFIKIIILFVFFIRNAVKVVPLTLVINPKAVFKGLSQESVGKSYKKSGLNGSSNMEDDHAFTFKQTIFIMLKANGSLSLIDLHPFKANLNT